MNIITGSGRSGTSFVAQIIDKIIGINGQHEWNEDVRAGMETKEIVDLNKTLFFVNGKEAPYSPQWLSLHEIDRAKYLMSSVLKLTSEHYKGEWIKDPLFSKTLQIWIDSHVSIENLIICTRNTHDSMLSAKKSNRGFEPAQAYTDWQIESEMHARQGYLWDTILRYGIKYNVVRYEHMLDDFGSLLPLLFPEKDKDELLTLLHESWNPTV